MSKQSATKTLTAILSVATLGLALSLGMGTVRAEEKQKDKNVNNVTEEQILRALSNVQPRHLLVPEGGKAKTRLSDVLYLAETPATDVAERDASERSEASHAVGASRRSGERERV